ncbi:MAG: hypothetical protein A2275_15195 [Bacteroidetes bacterium RIFOXYA12_FULL_35_11]|nr:MAG: hypothetical protein A2X01_18100 [Bacteroidetes bacterium GWF2_35_48]OFY80211.1 MAG: hypothetical protein A2275_15195 [Bacteroidetes bacterium RIFOXYA12_FULL_35_11]OFY95014.1 MAG: hypothetical protein A2491_16890 [Bacteroidetes bacterium RIFOXYC12_FULL_35_7]OFY97096.1 MAG: hypothetical protein A2309_01895 [Bacteroidetes bacterium RIFOXYB2_FULL_35_7]HBX51708.1 hypothetical protein [Bacteroidales bacterium]
MGYYFDLKFDTTKEPYNREKLMKRFCDAGCEKFPCFFAEIAPQGTLRFNQDNESIQKRWFVSLLFYKGDKPEEVSAGLTKFFDYNTSFQYRFFDESLNRYVSKRDISEIVDSFISEVKNHDDPYYCIQLEFSNQNKGPDLEDLLEEFSKNGFSKLDEDIKNWETRLFSPFAYPVWFSVTNEAISEGYWAYIRFSWCENKESMVFLLQEAFKLAEDVGCDLMFDNELVTRADVDREADRFSKSRNVICGAFGTISGNEVHGELRNEVSESEENETSGSLPDVIPDEILDKFQEIKINKDLLNNNCYEISKRAYQVLKFDAGFESFKDVVEHYSKNGNFMNFKNCGANTNQEIILLIELYYLLFQKKNGN